MYDTAIIGAGLAGLTTAALLARGGERVLVLDKSRHLGGRARTSADAGYRLNFGAHALYCRGHARRILDDLGVPYTGRKPPLSGLALTGDGEASLPLTPWSWLTTPLLSATQRSELARQFVRLATANPETWRGRSQRDYLAPIADERVRQVLLALFRVATYGNAPTRFDAGATLEQVQLALWGVLYLDDGWQTLVDGTAAVARACGAEIRTGVRAQDLDAIPARSLVIAASPKVAAALTGSDALARFAASAIPVHAACLDLALSMPAGPDSLAMGLDHATYLSVHSVTAALAPAGGSVVHALAYLGQGEAREPRAELEALLDRTMPTWRQHLVHQRYLPHMTVTHAMPAAATGGLGGRFAHQVPDRPDTYVVGDWVGSRGMLADAALASAEIVAEHLLRAAREAA